MDLTQNLQGALQSLEGVPRNALAWLTDPGAQARAAWGNFRQNLTQYNQLLEASGDPTRPPQSPAQAQARDQLTRLMSGMVVPEAGMMAGPAAATADLRQLAKAYALHNEGATAPSIWQQTGWAPHTPDAIPRFEIPDDSAQMSLAGLKALQLMGPNNPVPLSHVFQHPELLQAYPQLSRVQVQALPAGTQALGSFDPRTGIMSLNTDAPMYSRSTMLHELQHAVQGIEATSPGGSPEMFAPMHLDDLRRLQQLNQDLLETSPQDPSYHEMMAEREQILNDTATPVEEHASRVRKLLEQHRQEAQTYVEHANRGHPEAQRFVDDAVQQYLGAMDPEFAKAKAAAMTPRELQEQATAVSLARDNPRYMKASQAMHKALSRLSPMEQYKRLGGEAEARQTEARASLSPENRRLLYPYDPVNFQAQTKVPLAELIHLPGYRNALSAYLGGQR